MNTNVVSLEAVGARLREERERLGHSQGTLGELGGVTRNSQQAYEAGRRAPDADYLARVSESGVDVGYVVAGSRLPTNVDNDPLRRMLEKATDQQKSAIGRVLSVSASDIEPVVAAEQLDVIEVESVDQEYGMGATFADGPVQVDRFHFSRTWMQQVTPTAPAHLTWARGRGDSMHPTISDGEMVLIDRSERTIRDTDAIWAFTIGEFGYMKRLRVRGDQVTILSDNPSVPPDHATLDELNLIGRVSRVVKRV